MKRLTFCSVLLFITAGLNAQTFRETVMLNNIRLEIDAANNEHGGRVINIKKPADDTTTSLTVYTDNQYEFSKIFADKVQSFVCPDDNCTEDIKKFASELFIKLKKTLDLDNYPFIAGTLMVKKEIPVWYELYLDAKKEREVADDAPAHAKVDSPENQVPNIKHQKQSINRDTYLVNNFVTKDSIRVVSGRLLRGETKKTDTDSIMIEIKDGFIQNMIVFTTISEKNKSSRNEKFVLPYPVGISSISNLRNMQDIKLIPIDEEVRRLPDFIKTKHLRRKYFNTDTNTSFQSIYYMKLSDIIDYNYVLGIERRDYSPKDMVISLKSGESKVLEKEESYKLFEAHIFTDFIGLNDDKPNGLIQVQVQKRINLNTTQKLPRSYFIYRNIFKSFGYFNHISPFISFNKIENHNRSLALSDANELQNKAGFSSGASRYVNLLSLYEYQSFSGGFDLNLVYLYNHDSKLDFSVNAGLGLGVTKTIDSLNKEAINNASITTVQFLPELKMRFLPEERFNFSISNKLNYIKPLTQQVQMISTDKKQLGKMNPVKSGWINVCELLFSINLNEKTGNKLFGRLRLNFDMRNSNNSFSQVQMGYSTNILGKSK